MRTLHAATLLFSLCVLVPLAAPADLFRVDEDDDDDEEPLPDLGVADIDVNTTAEKGKYLGSPCEFTCNSNLHHVYCNPITEKCECEKRYPVKLGPTRGCAKPKRLGEQCYYTHTCSFMDPHASCIQINHNAVCQCKAGFHIVTLQRPNKRVFCAEDLVLLTTDLSALAGVATGIAILAGLICFVLRLFSQARYSRPRHFANANMAPPILFSSETGIPLASNSACGARSTSRSSQRSGATLVSGYSRRLSSAQGGSRGALVPASRAGAARAAAILLISCHQAHDAASDAVAAAAGVLREEADERASSPASEPPPAEPADERFDAACSSAPSSPTRFGKAVGRGPFRIFGAGASRDSGFTVNFKTASYVLGSRRPSIASIHSAGSLRSFGNRMYEKEREQKEQRHEMQIRLARMSSLPSPLPKPTTSVPTPSPLSTDELLPSVAELREVTLAMGEDDSSSLHGEIGPCSSKDCLN